VHLKGGGAPIVPTSLRQRLPSGTRRLDRRFWESVFLLTSVIALIAHQGSHRLNFRACFAALFATAGTSAFAHVPILDLDRGPSAFVPNGISLTAARPAEWAIDVAAQEGATWSRELVAGEGCVLVLQNAGNEPVGVTIVISQDDAGQAMSGTRPVSLRIPGHGRHALTLQASRPLSVSVYADAR